MLADITHNLIDDTWDDKEIKNSGERDRRQTSEFAPPPKRENLRTRRSIITSALAFTVSLYECRHTLVPRY